MALRFIDSFDHYSSSELLAKWTRTAGGGGPSVVAGGRHGNRLEFSPNRLLYKTLDEQSTWIVGLAIFMPSVLASDFLQIVDSGTTHVDVRVNASGNLTVTRAGTLLGTGAAVLSASVWYFVELKTTIHDSSGVVELRLNGVPQVTLSGIDTRNGANAWANEIGLVWNGAFGSVFFVDDLYVCDANGSVNNTFVGDCQVEAHLPNGNGNSSQFDGSDGNQIDNYLLVDETAPDGDTTYVESGDVGDKDTYAFTNVSGTAAGTVAGLQMLARARKTNTGNRKLDLVARHSATEEDSASEHALSTSYEYLREIRETKPGGGAWTLSDIDGAEFGVKVAV